MRARYAESSLRISTTIIKGLARVTTRSVAGNRVGRGGAPGRWNASPLRTMGRLKQPHSKALLLQGLREICIRIVRTAFPAHAGLCELRSQTGTGYYDCLRDSGFS